MTIYRDRVPDDLRVVHTAALFGAEFPRRLEPTVFTMAERLSPDYRGGYWLFYGLSNGGFYMAPDSEAIHVVRSENGFVGPMSSDALGITACLYAYSHLSFGDGAFCSFGRRNAKMSVTALLIVSGLMPCSSL